MFSNHIPAIMHKIKELDKNYKTKWFLTRINIWNLIKKLNSFFTSFYNGLHGRFRSDCTFWVMKFKLKEGEKIGFSVVMW